MKKILSILTAALAIFAAVTIVSCNDYSYSAATDTVYDLDSPSVTATAYYGFNLLTWPAVKGAYGYEIRIDGAVKGTQTDNYYFDNDNIVDGVSRTYEVIALSKSDPGRAAYAKNSTSGQVTCTGNVPSVASHNSLTLDSDYAAKFSTDNVASNVTASLSNSLGKIYVEYPAKSYLKYGFVALPENEFEAKNGSTFDGWDFSDDSYSSVYVDSDKAVASITNLTAGTKTVYIYVASKAGIYDKVTVDTGVEVEVPGFGVNYGSSMAVEYIDEGTTARVTWTPATLTDGTTAPTTDYVVYEYVNGAYTKVSGTVTAGTISGDDCYYVTDTVTDNEKNSTYYVVLTDGTHYGSGYGTRTLYAYTKQYAPAATITATVKELDADGFANDIYVVVSNIDEDTTVKAYYAPYTTNLDADYTEITLGNIAGNTCYATLKNLDPKEYTFKVVTSETGKEDTVSTDSATVNELTLQAPSFTVTTDTTINSGTTVYKAYINVIDSAASISTYTYTVYKSKITTDASTSVVTVGDPTTVGIITQFEYADGTYTGELTDTWGEGSYYYYVVKEDSATGLKKYVYSSTYRGETTYSAPYISSVTNTTGTISILGSVDADTKAAGYTWTLYYREMISSTGVAISNFTSVKVLGTAEFGTASGGSYPITISDTKTADKYYQYLIIGTLTGSDTLYSNLGRNY